MKKLVFLVVLVLVVSFLSAQGISAKGIKAGVNLANLSGDDVEDTVMKIGFAVGAFLTYDINEMIAVQPELLYTMKGAKMEIDGSDDDVIFKYDYIELPILFKYKIAMDGGVKPNIFLGPALAFNIAATYEFGDDDGDIEDTTALDYGLVFGAGVDINQITIDARYELGFASVDDSDAEADVKNNVISFLVGYGF